MNTDKLKTWKPNKDDKYWSVDSIIPTFEHIYHITLWTWEGDEYDKKNYRAGNVFKTKQDAKRVAKEMLKILKTYERG